ncbi:MAG: bifunctional 4-hydroxy-2-oxoglutarate aldolase/2-dehydro-3-deoxy-phosphogluconate aldolase [Synoicihabitans sp.]
MSKADIIQRLTAGKLIAMLQADSAAEIDTIANALTAGGISAWELPLTCPAIPKFLESVADQHPDFLFGLGTVIDTDTARRGILAGARFLSTPALRPDVILLCRRHQVPVICGAHSTEEIEAALLVGADAVKLYPSTDRFGPTHVREVRAKFPDALLFPVGGVSADNAQDFSKAGADALFVSSSLRATDDTSAIDHRLVSERAREIADGFRFNTNSSK